MSESSETYSIALRLRRVVHEDAYVAVPVTDAILRKAGDGSLQIDFDAFVAEAVRISRDSRVEWRVEESTVEAHPMQGPIPDDRTCFDAFHYDVDRNP